MRRIPNTPRQNWQAEVEKWGLIYHTFEGKPYWNESAYYTVSPAEVTTLEDATRELSRICLEAVDVVIREQCWADFAITPEVGEIIASEWDKDPPAIYGRYDLAFDGIQPPKLLEFNADTPTALLEAAVVQWQWLESEFKGADQFNSIWEALIAKWKALVEEGLMPGNTVHFGHEDSWEDLLTVTVLRDTAQQAGLRTMNIHMAEIGWDGFKQESVDLQNRPILTLFKLYPWEWLLHDEFGQNALKSLSKTQWIEPIWKMILSNKALLPLLWRLYPNHPNLLPAYLDGPRDMTAYVKKPLLSREGANVTVVEGGVVEETGGEYGEEGHVYQQLFRLPNFDGKHPVIGSWVVDFEPCGIGIRESDGLVTTDLASFVPHLIA